MNAINPSLSAGYPFIDPAIDRRLDAVPDSIKNQVSEVVNALLEQGIHPTPERVAAVMGRLARAPLERNLLDELLMRHWWIALNDTVEPDDPDALAAHLAWAPVREHPGHWYLAGFIAGLSAGHWYGFGYGHNATAHECWGGRS